MTSKTYKPQSFNDDRPTRGYCYDVPATRLSGIIKHKSGVRFQVGPTLVSDTLPPINFLSVVPETAKR